MKKNGWVFDVTHSNDTRYAKQCGTASWFGYSYGSPIGSVTALLIGSGNATLSYGNCYGGGRVSVYLNGNEISHAFGNTPTKEIAFEYTNRDVLTIMEMYIGIIKLNYLHLSCFGGKCID